MIDLQEIVGAEQAAAAARSRLYQALSQACLFPSQEFRAAVMDGTFRDYVASHLAALPYDLPADLAALADGLASYTDFQAEFIRLFEVGVGSPPCPLYGGLYLGGRRKVMEECTRFYNFFGLSSGGTSRELPDHLSVQLEFLHYLSFQEVAALQQEGDVDSYRRAQRDFLVRQVAAWTPRLAERVQRSDGPPFYRSLCHLIASFSRRDADYLHGLAG